MRIILGINAYHADASACIIINDKLVAAIEEERLNRVKHFSGYPINAIKECLNITKKNSTEIKSEIIEHLWKIIISDNAIDMYESNLMRRICGLIYFSDKESGEIKMKLMKSK